MPEGNHVEIILQIKTHLLSSLLSQPDSSPQKALHPSLDQSWMIIQLDKAQVEMFECFYGWGLPKVRQGAPNWRVRRNFHLGYPCQKHHPFVTPISNPKWSIKSPPILIWSSIERTYNHWKDSIIILWIKSS